MTCEHQRSTPSKVVEHTAKGMHEWGWCLSQFTQARTHTWTRTKGKQQKTMTPAQSDPQQRVREIRNSGIIGCVCVTRTSRQIHSILATAIPYVAFYGSRKYKKSSTRAPSPSAPVPLQQSPRITQLHGSLGY